MFKEGDLVWGKINGFPWWPAYIESLQPENKFKVNFIGENTFQILREEKLLPLDQTPLIDIKKLQKSKRGQKLLVSLELMNYIKTGVMSIKEHSNYLDKCYKSNCDYSIEGLKMFIESLKKKRNVRDSYFIGKKRRKCDKCNQIGRLGKKKKSDDIKKQNEYNECNGLMFQVIKTEKGNFKELVKGKNNSLKGRREIEDVDNKTFDKNNIKFLKGSIKRLLKRKEFECLSNLNRENERDISIAKDIEKVEEDKEFKNPILLNNDMSNDIKEKCKYSKNKGTEKEKPYEIKTLDFINEISQISIAQNLIKSKLQIISERIANISKRECEKEKNILCINEQESTKKEKQKALKYLEIVSSIYKIPYEINSSLNSLIDMLLLNQSTPKLS